MERSSCCRMCRSDALRPVGHIRGYDYRECSACGFAFAPAVDAGVLDELYRSGYRGLDGGAPIHGWAHPGFLEPAWAALGRDGPQRVIDFGAGDSCLPDLLRQSGHRVIGVDVKAPAQPHPDRLTGDLLELRLPSASFDLAYSFQVFEHLPEPAPILQELIRITRPGGIVLIHTDMETAERHAGGFEDWWYVAPPDHCSLYRHRTFDLFFEGTPHHVVWRGPKRVMIRIAPA